MVGRKSVKRARRQRPRRPSASRRRPKRVLPRQKRSPARTKAARSRPKKKAARPKTVAAPRSSAPVSPVQAVPIATPASDAVTPGTPQWQAYEAMVNRIESTYGVRIETMHRRLDKETMRGRSFMEMLGKLGELYGVSPADAVVVVRGYAGYETEDAQALDLRAFLKQWLKGPRRGFRPQSGLGSNFEIEAPPPTYGEWQDV